MNEKVFDYAIVLINEAGYWKVLHYGSNTKAHPESPIVMSKLAGYSRHYGSDNVLLLKNIPIKTHTICEPLHDN